MICQICKKNPSNIVFTIIINNEKKDMHFCNKCAEEKGVSNALGGIPFLLGGIILGIAEEKIKEMIYNEIPQKETVCSGCGLTYKKFRTSGLLGCELCYNTFDEDLKIILRRIHGNNRHFTSKIKSSLSNINNISELKEELNEAIKKEEFEKAAEIRDKIKSIEKHGK